MGVPVETARSRAQRGLAMLRERFDADHGGDRRAWAVPLLSLGSGGEPGAGGPGGVGGTGGGGGTAALAAKGAILMASATKIGIAAAVVLAAGLGLFLGLGGARVPEPSGTVDEPADGEIWLVEEGAPEREVASGTAMVMSEGGSVTQCVGRADGFCFVPKDFHRVAYAWAWAEGFAAKRIGPVDLTKTGARVALARSAHAGVRFVDDGVEVPTEEVMRRYKARNAQPEVVFIAESDLAGGPSATLRRLFALTEGWELRATLLFEAEGARIFPTPGDGAWWVMTTRPGAAPWFDRVTFGASGAERVVTVPLPSRVATVRVRAVADDTGKPVAGAVAVPYVEYGDDQAFARGWFDGVRGDLRGEIEIAVAERAPSGQRQVTWWVTAPGYAAPVSNELLRLSAGGGRDVRLKPTVTVKGTAWDRDGTPAFGRTVLSTKKGRTVTAEVSADGTFDVHDAFPGAALFLALDAEAVDVIGTEIPASASGTIEVTLGTPRSAGTGGVVRGRLTAGGVGISGALAALGKKPGRIVTTDAEGRFRADGVEAGDVPFEVLLGDPAVTDDFWIRSRTPIRLVAGAEVPLEFDLPAGVIRVRVVDADGAPIPHAVAYAAPEDSKAERDRFPGFEFSAGWCAVTDEKGWATLLGLVAGAPHRLLAGVKDGGKNPEERTGIVPGTAANPVAVVVRVAR